MSRGGWYIPSIRFLEDITIAMQIVEAAPEADPEPKTQRVTDTEDEPGEDKHDEKAETPRNTGIVQQRPYGCLL